MDFSVSVVIWCAILFKFYLFLSAKFNRLLIYKPNLIETTGLTWSSEMIRINCHRSSISSSEFSWFNKYLLFPTFVSRNSVWTKKWKPQKRGWFSLSIFPKSLVFSSSNSLRLLCGICVREHFSFQMNYMRIVQFVLLLKTMYLWCLVVYNAQMSCEMVGLLFSSHSVAEWLCKERKYNN